MFLDSVVLFYFIVIIGRTEGEEDTYNADIERVGVHFDDVIGLVFEVVTGHETGQFAVLH